MKFISLVFIVIFFLIKSNTFACTSVKLDSDSYSIFAKNYDWYFERGAVLVNKRNVAKRALVSKDNVPAEWISKYGSITFNQFGRELPIGGMNEAGLVVETLVLPETKYPEEELPSVNELQWIQYVLDNFSSVDELEANVDKFNIAPIIAKLHYHICDAFNTCAIAEYLNGMLFFYKRTELSVLTNSQYASSVRYRKKFVSFGGTEEIPSDDSTLSRFVRISFLAKYFNPVEEAYKEAFNILDQVSPQDKNSFFKTQWQLVYDFQNKHIYYHTARYPKIKKIVLSDFSFSCAKPVQILRMNTLHWATNVRDRFKDYSYYSNLNIIKRNAAFMKLSDEMIERLARYPASTVCLE